MAKQNSAPDATQNSDQPQLTLEEALSQLQQATTDLATTSAVLRDTKQQLESIQADRDTLADANQKLQAQLEDKTSELELAEGLIEQQTAALKSAEVTQTLGPVVVSHEKEQYRVLVERFSHNGNLVEAASLRQNPDLVRQLVEMGSGLLVKVEAA